MIYRIAIGEKLLIKPILLSPPFDYFLIDIQDEDETVVKTGIITDLFKEILIDRVTFLIYRGKTLLLRLEETGQTVEESMVLISGLYDLLPDIKIIKGLLGDRRKETQTDHQEGHPKAASIAIYTDNALTNEIDTYDLVKDYMTDFVPDWRFHIQHEKITN